MWPIDSDSTNAAMSAATWSTACRAVRGGSTSPQCAQPGDGRPGPEARPRPDPRRGRIEVLAARRDPFGREDPRVAPEFLGRFPERRLADIVAAHDELARLGQGRPRNIGSSRHQPGAVRQAPRHRREPEGDRRADAPECAH